MWLKLLASLCWTVCLTDWETGNSLLFQHSFLASAKFHKHSKHILQCQSNYCGAELACPFEVEGVVQAVFHEKLDPATLSTCSAYHNTVGQQGGIFSCLATLA